MAGCHDLVESDFATSQEKRPGLGRAAPVNECSADSDGEEAIVKAAEYQPDIILLDIGLPS